MSPRHARRSSAPETVRKGLLILAAVTAAYWTTWLEIRQDVWEGSYLGYFYVLLGLAAFAAAGIALRRGGELPIHDRQTDIIVGALGLGLAAAVIGLLVPRYRYQYELLHLDVLSAWLFLFSACVLLFGLRPVARFWPVWVFLLVASPTLYRLLMVTLGGDRTAAGVTMLLFAGVAAGIGAARTMFRGLVAALITLAVGGAGVLVIRTWFPAATIYVYQAVPSVLAIFVGCGVMYVAQRWGAPLKPLGRPLNPLTAAQSWSAVATVVVATALVAVIPIPEDYDKTFPVVPGLVIAHPPTLPPGWQLLEEVEFPWAQRYLGPQAHLVRRYIRAERGNPVWDKDSRRRRVVIDTVRADDEYTIHELPEFVLYRLPQPRISPPTFIDLGHGVTARLNIVLDDRRLLSWTWLSWNWAGAGGAERITLIAADNHLPDAEFPALQHTISGNIGNLLNQFLRGNAVVLDTHSHAVEADLEPKDQDMLTSLARAMVEMRAS
ncbi:hypothetical protein [Nocardia sp. NPDC051832]|uniref:hypothetical protein n=1 Tax=Nocardia sp. NPDC051832 TaxID=3155673 RepID=UPI003422BDA0